MFLHSPPLPVQDTNPTDYRLIFIKQSEIDELLKHQQNSMTDIAIKLLMTKNIFVMMLMTQQKKKVAIDIPQSRINDVYQSKIVISFHIPTLIPISP